MKTVGTFIHPIPKARRCKFPSCNTILNSYNPSEECLRHPGKFRMVTKNQGKRQSIKLEPPVENSEKLQECIIEVLCDVYNVNTEELTGWKKVGPVREARWVLIYLLREDLKLTMTTIGRLLSGRGESTIESSYNAANGLLKRKPEFSKEIEYFRSRYKALATR